MSKYAFKEAFFAMDKENAKGIQVEVYINPTSDEIKKKVPFGARGYVDIHGNLYLEAYQHPTRSMALHDAILSIIYYSNDRLFPYIYVTDYTSFGDKILQYGITVQRFEDTNKIYIGESVSGLNMKQSQQIMNLVKKKNPQWEFINESIRMIPNSPTPYEDTSNMVSIKSFYGESSLKEDIMGHTAICYHRTGKISDNDTKNARNKDPTTAMQIVYHGYKKLDYESFNQSGGLYGVGLYGNYTLEGALKPGYGGRRTKAGKYGPFLISFKVNLDRFIILDEPYATQIYGDKHKLKDQLELLGFFKYIQPNAKQVVALKGAKIQIYHKKGNIYIVPTKDYQIAKRSIKVLPTDEIIADKDQITINRKGTLFTQLTMDKVKSIYAVSDEPDEEKKSFYDQIMKLCKEHEKGKELTSMIGTPLYALFHEHGKAKLWYMLANGLIYTGANDYESLVVFRPNEDAIPYACAYAPDKYMATDSGKKLVPLKPEEVKFVKIGKKYMQRWLSVVKRGEPSKNYPLPIMKAKESLQESFHFSELSPEQKEKIYTVFTHSYTKATGSSWDKNKFWRRAEDWTFFGDDNGGIAIREQKSGLNKLVSAFGSPKSVINGFKELLAVKGKEPIWGGADDKLAAHLEANGFHRPPKFVMKLLLPKIAPTLGDEVEGIADDGGLLIRLKHSGEVVTKYVLGNNAYFKWLATLGIPGMAGKWITTTMGKIGNFFKGGK